jgi:hypothetical protein
MTERLPRLMFVTLALAYSLAAPSTWATTGKNSCRSPARIVDADHLYVSRRYQTGFHPDHRSAVKSSLRWPLMFQ